MRKGVRVLVIWGGRSFQAKREDSDETEQVIKIVAEDVALQLTRIESITFAAKPQTGEAEPLEDVQ